MEKADVYNLIAKSTIFGNLGLFVGSGFSKAVCESPFINKGPLSWEELLKKTCEHYNLEWEEITKKIMSYPEIASEICRKIMQKREQEISLKSKKYYDIQKEVKASICEFTSWYPNEEQRTDFSPLLKSLEPQWIITTNYDLVLESLLPDFSISLSPENSLVYSKSSIPIYHLHGIRSNPDTLIITNEDYVKLFRPTEYRLHKLSLTLSESTTLIMGYGVGDQNVLTALDWSKNVYSNKSEHFPNEIIQIMYSEDSTDEVSETEDGMIILKTSSLLQTLKEIKESIEKNNISNTEDLDKIKKITIELCSLEEDQINTFIMDQDKRKALLMDISPLINKVTTPFLMFLNIVFDKSWEKTHPTGAFSEYAIVLNIIIDLFSIIEYEKMPPALFGLTANNLSRLSWYIGNGKGESHYARRVWDSRNKEIPEPARKELSAYAQQYNYYKLLLLLDATEEPS